MFGALVLCLAAVYAPPVSNPGNVLLIVADDLGVGSLAVYGERSDISTYPFPVTPNIDSLKENGVLFRNVWASPTCSPTRACILTGRYGFRTGIGSATLSYNLPMSEVIIPEVLGASFRHALIGKWHLSNVGQSPFTAPNDYGFQYFAGTSWNISDYCHWPLTVDGVLSEETVYATTSNVNAALTWIHNGDPRRWFLEVAFNAPHSPYHMPGCPSDYSGSEFDRYQSMIETMDLEIGRLLAGVDLSTTTVIFMGDNGTPGPLTVAPFDQMRAKGTIYEGGIRVPFIVAYNKVTNPNRESLALVNVTDVFATTLDLMGVVGLASDSKSLVPIMQSLPVRHHSYIYSERFPNGNPLMGDYCIRNAIYKYMKTGGQEHFYNLQVDPFENDDLINNPSFQIQINVLKTAVNNLRNSQ